MILIGVTGIVGSGKTTVSGMLQRAGLAVLDLDKIAKEVVQREDVKKDIEKELGSCYITEGTLNIQKTRDFVFKEPAALEKLENIIHPRIKEAMCEKIKGLQARGVSAVVIDAPLLFEKGLQKELNKTVVVSANAEKTKERLRKRGLQEDDINRRTAIQIPLNEKEAMADYVVHNNGAIEDLEQQIDNLLHTIKEWEVEPNAS